MILVTGAAGKTGRAVIRALIARGATVRALVHRPSQMQPLEALGAHEVLSGDMRTQATMERATQGIRSLYHICPNMSPDELTIGRLVIGAACSANVEHFIYHSVLRPQTEAMPHHWQKLRVEEHLFKSGLPYTILQPAAYMQNVLAGWDSIVNCGVYRVPYAVETQLGMVHLADVATAAAIVLTEPGHVRATYELAGAELLTQAEVATILSQSLGRRVRAETVPLEEWKRQARADGLSNYQVETLAKMFRYYECYGFGGNPNILAWLLGRPPTTFGTFVEQAAHEMQVPPEVLKQ